MKNAYILAIIAAVAVIAVVSAALLMTEGSDDSNNDDSCTVSFDTGEGSYVPSQTVKKGSKATEPNTFREGYSFQGWYTAASGGSKFDFSTKITGNMTLYARWAQNEAESFRVTFDANGGSADSFQVVKSGGLLTKPEDPTRSGYRFQGWYTTASGGDEYEFSKPVTSSFTLYAHWAPGSQAKTCTVTFVLNDGTAGKSTVAVESGSRASSPTAPSRTGYSFDGWYTAAAGGARFDFATKITSDTTLYAHWTANAPAQRHTVTFDANGGSPTTEQTVSSGDYASIPASPARPGYKMIGWYTAAEGGERYEFSTPVRSDLTLYAHWAVDSPTQSYRVAFDTNGGSTGSFQVVKSGGLLTKPEDPTRSGYRFQGWYTAASGGSKYDFSTPVDSSFTLYAHWAASGSVRHTVTFDANGGAPSSTQTVKDGGYASAPADPVRLGYRFQGWYTSPSGGSEFKFGTKITEDVTLYAHWSLHRTCVVTLVNYPGYLDDAETYTVDYGETFEHSLAGFGRSLEVAYSPDGPFHHADYDDGKLSVEKGFFVSTIKYGPVTENITLYYRFAWF
ncbi:MAG: InlB B-repeat-containing protein [Candidatus Methanomethylophilaceae archaeon]|nr:InlB B-repeat-containing protein [Candidatus Methanomethylophilaceae archaeon]